MQTTRFSILQSAKSEQLFTAITRGIEKENLRVTPQGEIATSPHPVALGAALTNGWVTTDFSEALLEVITPAEQDSDLTYNQLKQVSAFVAQNIGKELIWPSSMPVEIASNNCVPLAYYGENNVGRMKTLYRKGLCHRYGRVMQVIAGIHYNFSLPEKLFTLLQQEERNKQNEQDFISGCYMHMVRNFFHHAWLLPYLFGASPACAESSVIKQVDYLKPFAKQSFYGPYATSLRLGDLGYQNKGQDLLNISYANVDDYAKSLSIATKTPYPEFTKIGVQHEENYKQLNDALLQIANEYYSPIRPKQIAYSCEQPTTALLKRGVAYLEVRMLDLNPLTEIGICPQQMAFMDVFLTYCLLKDGLAFSNTVLSHYKENIKRVAVSGRDPELTLISTTGKAKLTEQARQLFAELHQVAELLTASTGDDRYQQAVNQQEQKLLNVTLTPSAQLLEALLSSDQTFQKFHLQQARLHTEKLQQEPIALLDLFNVEAEKSLKEFAMIEKAEQKPFAEFLQTYFSQQC